MPQVSFTSVLFYLQLFLGHRHFYRNNIQQVNTSNSSHTMFVKIILSVMQLVSLASAPTYCSGVAMALSQVTIELASTFAPANGVYQ